MKEKDNKTIFDFFQEPNANLQIIPINYRLMKKLSSEERLRVNIAESEFHQTKTYKLNVFYKSVSPCVNFKRKDDNK